MGRPNFRFVETNGIRMHVAEQGSGPLVVLCHGFPESWYSWRTQLSALAEAGFHAVAPDMRGYGQTDHPQAVDAYTIFHHVGDMVGLLDALNAQTAVIAGHDWGSPVAWRAAMMRPDRFRAVIGLSSPYGPRSAERPTTTMPKDRTAQFYQLYFQTPGVAEEELERDIHGTLRRMFSFGFGNDAAHGDILMVPRSGGFLTRMIDPSTLPAWLTAADLDFYTAELTGTGFRGGLNWYRNIDRNWELTAPFAGAKVTVPALFIYGDQDPVLRFPGMDQLIRDLSRFVPRLQQTLCLPDCGHWTQQERAPEVNNAIIQFLNRLQ